jgi:hypothetical protein
MSLWRGAEVIKHYLTLSGTYVIQYMGEYSVPAPDDRLIMQNWWHDKEKTKVLNKNPVAVTPHPSCMRSHETVSRFPHRESND